MKVLISGGTGLIGKSLGLQLTRRGDQVSIITRNAVKARRQLPFPAEIFEGDLSGRPITQLLQGEWDVVVNLMGENVGEGRWTPDRKRRMVQSRLNATKNLIQSLRPGAYRHFVAASAVGYYGDRGDEPLNESSHPAQGFLPDLCRDWEELSLHGHRNVSATVARLGFVLDSQEGGLPKLISLFQKGLGSQVGSGDQYLPWVHVEDVVRAFIHWIDHPEQVGIFNLVSPRPVRNSEFTNSLCEVLGCFHGPRVPALAVQALYGEMATVVLASQKVAPTRLLESGFKFKFGEIDRALFSLLGSFDKGHRLFEVKQYIPAPLEKVFSFFAEAKNLERLTPPNLNFHILNTSTPEIQAGTLIDYKLKIRGIPVGWKTEIETWDPPHSFADNQLSGPYTRWHHVHQFETLGEGTLMTDSVTYKLPLGLLGRIGAGSFVDRDVFKIFDYRRQVIQEIFG